MESNGQAQEVRQTPIMNFCGTVALIGEEYSQWWSFDSRDREHSEHIAGQLELMAVYLREGLLPIPNPPTVEPEDDNA